jgi:hypothetical protein
MIHGGDSAELFETVVEQGALMVYGLYVDCLLVYGHICAQDVVLS